MLVLSRKIGEIICIDDAIEVSVLEIRGNRVRLGINAPKDIPIHRPESPCLSVAGANKVHDMAIHRTEE